MERTRLRAWGGPIATNVAFPLAALPTALLVFATAEITPGLVAGLIITLVPWALLAGDIRLGGWAIVVGGVGVPGVVAVVYEAQGAIFLALLALAWVASSGESLGAEVTAFVASIAIPFVETAGEWSEERQGLVFFATGTLLTWLLGRVLRRERELVAALTDAHDRLNEAAAAAERQRIAHDVHDVVGHSLTVVLLNVAGARRVLAQDPAAAAEALDRAEEAGRNSLERVRAVVGLLRSPGATTELKQPGAADIAELVATAAVAGLLVSAELSDGLEDVDAYAGLAAYRLVQEALSNVEHHAPSSKVIVRVTKEVDRVEVSVRNALIQSVAKSRRAGMGLEGMRQRIIALGGTISAGPHGDCWIVEGTIPLQRTDASR